MKIISALFLLIFMAVPSLSFGKALASSNSNITNNMLKKPKLLFLSGSARKSSLNKMLAHNAFELAKGLGADVTFIDLKDYPMPIYDGDLETNEGLPEKALELKKLFAEHDGVFIASPEYNGSISPLLKNTLDWISRQNKTGEPIDAYQNKVVAMGCASPGRISCQRGPLSLQIMLSSIGVVVLPKKINVLQAPGKFNEAGLLTDVDNYEQLKSVIAEFIRITTAIKNG